MVHLLRSRQAFSLGILVLTITCILSSPTIDAARVDISGRPSFIISTTEQPPSGVIDDQVNWATTSENTDNAPQDNVCLRCYDRTQAAQDAVEAYNNLVKKSRKIRRRAGSTRSAPNASRPVDTTNDSAQNSSINMRTLDQPGMKIISRLRVARSPAIQQAQQRPSLKNKHLVDKKEAESERLKAEQESMRLKACSLLFEVHYCLRELQNECIGDLSFHMYETFFEQSRYKLLCVDPDYPNVKPIRHFGSYRILQEEKSPYARPDSSPEEVRKRLHQILPDRPHPRTLGVELKQQPDKNVGAIRRSTSMPLNNHAIPSDNIIFVPICLMAVMVVVLLAVSYYLKPRREEEHKEQDG